MLERLQARCGVKADVALDVGRSEIAAAVLGTGRYRQLVRQAIASIVASSSRWALLLVQGPNMPQTSLHGILSFFSSR